MVGNDQILFDEHQIVHGASLQLIELFPEGIQSFLEELSRKKVEKRQSVMSHDRYTTLID